MVPEERQSQTRFGFTFRRGSVHLARTIMLEDFGLLLSSVNNQAATKADYRRAIIEENCLGKRSGKTRELSVRHLVDLYGLDPTITLFRVLLYFWKRDVEGRPLLALLCAYSRDSLLQRSTPFILNASIGSVILREDMERYIEEAYPDRFSRVTLRSIAKNLNASWTKSGHLTGKVKKVRSQAHATTGSVSYALLLGYLIELRGEMLLTSEYTHLLDCSTDRVIELAEDASRRGWIVFKRLGNVVEILFPALLTEQEMEWVREQG